MNVAVQVGRLASYAMDDSVMDVGNGPAFHENDQDVPTSPKGSEAVCRIIAANRALFDAAVVAPGRAARQSHEAEAALVEERAARAELQRLVHAYEASTAWRVTRPIRWVAERLRRKPHPGPPPLLPLVAPVALSYSDWVTQEEPTIHARLLGSGPGHARGLVGTIGVVVEFADISALAEMLGTLPQRCRVIILHPPGAAVTFARPGLITLPVMGSAGPAERVALAAQLDVDFLCFPVGTDRWAPDAFALIAATLAEQPETDLLFGDEDTLDATGQRAVPFFKPGWDRELQRGRDLVGSFAVMRSSLISRCAAALHPGAAWRYDLASRVAASTVPGRIRHVPAILNHQGPRASNHSAALRACAQTHMAEAGVAGRPVDVTGQPGWSRIAYDLPSPPPLVSLIVPTRDHAALLQACADGLLRRTIYPAFEVLIVDNGSEEPEALALIADLAIDRRVRVLRQPGAFNWSALNNTAARDARGDILVLLNNDVVVLEPDWLEILVSHVVQPGIGAVGAKLLYQDGRVQHAGLATDSSGIPRHLFRYEAAEAVGASGLLGLARQVWAVTGACLAVRRSVFFAVGGLNEALPVAYNDVDFCLRLTVHGYSIVWTPFAVLEHREMASRAPDHTEPRRNLVQEELARLQRDWGWLVFHDPFLNPAYTLQDEHPCLMPSASTCGSRPA